MVMRIVCHRAKNDNGPKIGLKNAIALFGGNLAVGFFEVYE